MKRARKRSAAAAAIQETSPSERQPAGFISQIIAVVLAGVVVRLLYIWQIHGSPFFNVLMGDSRRYDFWARQVAGGDVIGREVFYQAPLYPYVLGGLYAVAGPSTLTVRVCQTLIGTATCVFVALTARRLFSERAGLIAGLGLAFYAPAVFFDGLVQKSVLDLFFVSLSLWIVSGLVDKPDTRSRWFALGTAIGALALTRENALIFAAAILIWPPGRVSSTQRQRLLSSGVFLLGLALVLLPVAARNRIVGGEWHVTTSQLGPNLYIGNNPSADGTYAALREGRGSAEYERQDATELAEAATGRLLTPGEVSHYWIRRTLEFVTSQPGEWLSLMGRKAALLWNRTEFVDTESQESYEDWSPLLRALARVGHFGVLVPLAVFGVFATWRDRARIGVYYMMAALYAASVVLFYVSARYRLPLVPFLMLFAAAGMAALPAFIRGAGRRRVAIVLALVIAVAFVTNRPLLSADLMKATTETNLGVALQTENNLEEAEARYRRALALQPDYAPAYVNLGMLLFTLQRTAEAIDAYRRAIELGSTDEDLDLKIGTALLQAGRAQEAAVYLERAAAGGGRSAALYDNLGVALSRTGRKDEAIAAYREALQIAPDDSALHFALGSLLVEQERYEEAVDAFRAGLQLRPESAEAHNNLGGALAASGRTSEAIPAFERALQLNPNLVSARRNLDVIRGRSHPGK